MTAEEKVEVKRGIKEGLEGLAGKVPGLLDIRVVADGRLESSNCETLKNCHLAVRFLEQPYFITRKGINQSVSMRKC